MPTWLKSSMTRARRGSVMPLENLGDLPLDRVQGIERRHRLLEDGRHRLLEDDGDVVAANLADLALGQVHQLLSLEGDRPRRMVRRRIGRSFNTDSAVTDLPEPDSPTRASVSPLATSKETRSTASVSRSPWRKATERSRTESKLMSAAPECRRG
jgi:hypothetical protein